MPSTQKMKDFKIDMHTTSNDAVICIEQICISSSWYLSPDYGLPSSVMTTFMGASGTLALIALKNSS